MNSPQLGLRVASVIFGAIGIAHLLRLLVSTPVEIGGYEMPQWISALGFFVTAGLCLWLWRLGSPGAKPPVA